MTKSVTNANSSEEEAQIYEFRDHLRNTIELTETASARLLITCSTLLATQGATA